MGRNKAWPAALMALLRRSSEDLHPATCGAALGACAEGSQWVGALALLADLRRKFTSLPNAVCLLAVLTACSRAARWRHALAAVVAYPELANKPASPKCAATLVAACAAGAAWQSALALLRTLPMNGWPLGNVTSRAALAYAAPISGCRQVARWQHALILFHTARRASRLEAGSPSLADTACLNAALSACDRRGSWRSALLLLREAESWRLRLDSVSFNATISACDAHVFHHTRLDQHLQCHHGMCSRGSLALRHPHPFHSYSARHWER